MTNLLVRRPVCRVLVENRLVSGVLEATAAYGFGRRISEATVVFHALPAGVGLGDTIRVEMGPSVPETRARFTGFIQDISYDLYPGEVALLCIGRLSLADENHDTQDGIDFSGQTDIAIHRGVFEALAIPADYYQIGDADGLGYTLGTVSPAFVWPEGVTGLEWLERLGEVCLGWRVTDMPSGQIRRIQVKGEPDASAALSFAEGVDIVRGSARRSVADLRNRVVATGYDDAYYSLYAENPLVRVKGGIKTDHPFQSAFLERAGRDSPGSGISCQEWCEWRLAQVNRENIELTFTTHRGDLLLQGQTIAITSPHRGVTENFYVKDVTVRSSRKGSFTQEIVAIGGRGTGAPTNTEPVADFSLWTEQETVLVAGAEVPLYTVYCQAVAIGNSGPITAYNWTATGGTPSSHGGAGENYRTFVTTYDDIAGKSILLEVTDSLGQHAPVSHPVPAAANSTYVRRRLYTAEWPNAAAFDGQAWRTAWPGNSEPVDVACWGPSWAAGDTVLSSEDYLAASYEAVPEPCVKVTALWREMDADDQKVLAGLENGDLALSGDAGRTFPMLLPGPVSAPVLRCAIDRFAPDHWYVLYGCALYHTLDGGQSFAPLLEAQSGETFTDLCVSHSNIVVAMEGGRKAADIYGNSFLLDPAVDPAPVGMLAVAPDVVLDHFYFLDSDGYFWHTDGEPGSKALVRKAALPTGCVAKARSLARDGYVRGLLLIAAGTGGAYKTVNAGATDGGFFPLRVPGVGNCPADADVQQIGLDPRLTEEPVTPATVVSSSSTKLLDLWNGSGNDDPPAGWYTLGFDDAGWSAATEYGDSTIIAGAKNVGPAAIVSGSQRWLARHHFTLSSGRRTTAVLADTAHTRILECYVNGYSLGAKTSVETEPRTIDVDPALLRPGENVLAYLCTNEVA